MILLTVILTLFSTSASSSKDLNILAYVDRGIKYYPKYVKKGHVKYGKASWYGIPFHGRLTANGERYNMYNMTAAHRTYAMGTVLKVTNLQNRRSVKVRINDRGPFYNTRNIDLSYGAAKKLGMVDKGVERVKIEVLSSGFKSSKKINHFQKRTIISKNPKSANYIIVTSKKIVRDEKVQIGSFLKKENALKFIKKNRLKNSIILDQYIPKRKKTTYKVVINCTPWEARHLLKSKKFSGAYLLRPKR